MNDMNETTNEMEMDAELVRDEIPRWSGLMVEDDRTSVPKGSLARHIVLAMALEAQAPRERTKLEEERLARMVRARVFADRELDTKQTKQPKVLRKLRGDVVSLSSSVSVPLYGYAGSKVPALAERAAEVARVVFPRSVKLQQVTPPELWREVEKVRATLEDEAVLESLKRFVPEEVIVALFEANDRLGGALGLTEWKSRNEAELEAARDYLFRKMTAYVRVIAASADDDDLSSVKRARLALQPVADFRAANARRKAAGVEEEEPESPEEADEDVVGVSPAPLAPRIPEVTAPPEVVAGGVTD